MKDWMNELRESVANEQQTHTESLVAEELARHKASQIVAQAYDQIHKDFQMGELTAFNRAMLESFRGEVKLRYPDNVVNAGELFLDLGPFRVKLKWNASKGLLTAQTWQYVNRGEKLLRDRGSQFSVECDGKNLLIFLGGGRSLTDIGDLKQRLLGGLYRRFMLSSPEHL